MWWFFMGGDTAPLGHLNPMLTDSDPLLSSLDALSWMYYITICEQRSMKEKTAKDLYASCLGIKKKVHSPRNL